MQNDSKKQLQFFQVKLFREWSAKWPEDLKIKLKEKILELDGEFGEKLSAEIAETNALVNGTTPPAAELPANEGIVA